MALLNIRGFVLKEQFYKESDKIVTVLAKDVGKITFNAKGARNTKSKFLASTSLFSYADFILYEGRGFYSVTQSELINSFYNVRIDLDKLNLASYLADLVIKTSHENLNQNDVLLLLIKTFYMLADKDADYDLNKIKAVFELKFLMYHGYMPHMESCLICSKSNITNPFFDIARGGLICSEHSGNTGTIISESLKLAINYIINARQHKMFSFYLNGYDLNILAKLADEYLRYQMPEVSGNLKSVTY